MRDCLCRNGEFKDEGVGCALFGDELNIVGGGDELGPCLGVPLLAVVECKDGRAWKPFILMVNTFTVLTDLLSISGHHHFHFESSLKRLKNNHFDAPTLQRAWTWGCSPSPQVQGLPTNFKDNLNPGAPTPARPQGTAGEKLSHWALRHSALLLACCLCIPSGSSSSSWSWFLLSCPCLCGRP